LMRQDEHDMYEALCVMLLEAFTVCRGAVWAGWPGVWCLGLLDVMLGEEWRALVVVSCCAGRAMTVVLWRGALVPCCGAMPEQAWPICPEWSG